MLYMFNEYLEENPRIDAKNTQGLKKFQDSPKHLHEMTVEELNEVAKNCNAITEEVASKYKREIKHYLKWLNSKNIQVNPTIAERIKFPIADMQFLVYSTEDIAYYYDLFFKALEKYQTRKTTINKGTFLMGWASGILAFHGLTPEQIIDLDLNDVTSDGVKGYDLPLSKEDIKILIQYKDLKKTGNKKDLVGNKYIRTTPDSKGEINFRFLSIPLWRNHLGDEDNYLKGILRVTNLYQLGIFNRLYEYEKEHNLNLNAHQATPEWFIKIGRLENRCLNNIVKTKKDYFAYRTERDESQKVEVTKQQSPNYNEEFGTPTNKILVDVVSSGGKVAFSPVVDLREKINDELDMIIKDLDNLRARVYQMKDEINNALDQLIK